MQKETNCDEARERKEVTADTNVNGSKKLSRMKQLYLNIYLYKDICQMTEKRSGIFISIFRTKW